VIRVGIVVLDHPQLVSPRLLGRMPFFLTFALILIMLFILIITIIPSLGNDTSQTIKLLQFQSPTSEKVKRTCLWWGHLLIPSFVSVMVIWDRVAISSSPPRKIGLIMPNFPPWPKAWQLLWWCLPHLSHCYEWFWPSQLSGRWRRPWYSHECPSRHVKWETTLLFYARFGYHYI